MFPIIHFLSSIIPVILLFPIYKYWILGFFIGASLIDVDHYLWYIIRFKDFSLKKAYAYYLPENKHKREKDILNIFHVWEFWVLMVLLSFVHKFFFIVLLGMVLHLILDFIDFFKRKAYGLRAISYFLWLKRHPKRILE